MRLLIFITQASTFAALRSGQMREYFLQFRAPNFTSAFLADLRSKVGTTASTRVLHGGARVGGATWSVERTISKVRTLHVSE